MIEQSHWIHNSRLVAGAGGCLVLRTLNAMAGFVSVRYSRCARPQRTLLLGLLFCLVAHTTGAAEPPARFFAAVNAKDADVKEPLSLTLRYREPLGDAAKNRLTFYRDVQWDPRQTAVIVCDMWDSHHSQNAARRVGEVAPRMNALLKRLRARGSVIVHAPSSCVDAYAAHPARLRTQQVPKARTFPPEIAKWCYQIPEEEQVSYPLDQTRGENDDDPKSLAKWHQQLKQQGRNPKAPWQRQIETLTISPTDYLSDQGEEIWSILEQRNCTNVILVGVHTNMCVLGRPFGLRRMAANGKRVVLCRDLTDTIYNPQREPFVDHFTGNDLIVQHIETTVCPTITSDQILGGKPFRFPEDQRKRLVVISAEQEYKTEQTLPAFARSRLGHDYSVEFVFADPRDRNRFVGLPAVQQADALLISVRRRTLPPAQLKSIRDFIEAGKPVIGIRTASHAFCLRGKPAPKGLSDWPEFDAEVFGGSYTNHYGNSLKTTLLADAAADSPIFKGIDLRKLRYHGSLYRVNPLADTTRVLLSGRVPDRPAEPVLWTNTTKYGGNSVYLSFGHVQDFEQPAFTQLLKRVIDWCTDSATTK